jgi:amino acid adenylation domain-containing protein
MDQAKNHHRRSYAQWGAVREALRSSRMGMPLRKKSPGAPSPLSCQQRRLLYVNAFEGGGPAYNCAFLLTLHGSLNEKLLEKAIDAIAQRHVVLRTTFVREGLDTIQRLDEGWHFRFTTRPSSISSEDDVREFAENEAHCVFDPASAPPWKSILVSLDGNRHVVLLVFHSLIFDRWSMAIFLAELSRNYLSYVHNTAPMLSELPLDYADFSFSQREFIGSDRYNQLLIYWKNTLKNIPATSTFLSDYPRPPQQTYRGMKLFFTIDGARFEGLERLCRAFDSSFYTIFLSAFSILLARYSQQRDLCIGTPITSRNHRETHRLIGPFVNMLAVRIDCRKDISFKEFLKTVERNTMDAFAHQDMPFEKLVEELRHDRTVSHNPLFQVLFMYQNIRINKINAGPVSGEASIVNTKTSVADVGICIDEGEAAFSCFVEFNTDLYERTSAQRIVTHFTALIDEILSHPDKNIDEFEMISSAERNELLRPSQTNIPRPDKCTLRSLFENQAEKTPGAVAAIAGNCVSTYRELNECANRFAHFLIAKGVTHGDVTGVLLPRGLQQLQASIGALKAGATLIGLDPNCPHAYLEKIVLDSKMRYCIGTGQNQFIAQDQFHFYSPDAALACQEFGNPGVSENYQDKAIIIYTSGSTGKPKGVILENHGIINHAFAKIEDLELCEKDFFCHNLSTSFVASLWLTWAPLFIGAKIKIYPESVFKDTYVFFEHLDKDRITVVEMVPGLLQSYLTLLRSGKPKLELSSLKKIVLTGEPVPPALVDSFYRDYRIALINAYGQTECSDDTFHYKIPVSIKTSYVPIGNPIKNISAYILDEQRRLQPSGACGELCISGTGVAAGYLNDPNLTSEKFVADPFFPDRRMFLSGDRARLRPDGTVEALGRIDNTVKIRGHKIDVREVENCLLEFPEISSVAVSPYKNGRGDWALCAYVSSPVKVCENLLHKRLFSKLPGYMVPSRTMQLDFLPLTVTGKIDKKALPIPGDKDRDVLTHHVGNPEKTSETEKLLITLWEKALNRSVGKNDDFFEIGGHSLLAVELVWEIERAFNKQVPASILFEAPTIRQLAQLIDAEDAEPTSSLLKINDGRGPFPLICFHAVGGEVFFYRQLASRLKEECPVYGVRFPENFPIGIDACSFERLSQRYSEEICRNFPLTPVLLCGMAAGGILAYETARRLKERNRDIRLLVLFDSVPPNTGSTKQFFIRRIKHFIKEPVRRKIRFLRGIIGRALGLLTEQEKGLLMRNRAAKSYIARPYQGSMTIVLSEEYYKTRGINFFKAWEKCALGGVGYEYIPATPHEGLLDLPFVVPMAEKIKALIRSSV